MRLRIAFDMYPSVSFNGRSTNRLSGWAKSETVPPKEQFRPGYLCIAQEICRAPIVRSKETYMLRINRKMPLEGITVPFKGAAPSLADFFTVGFVKPVTILLIILYRFEVRLDPSPKGLEAGQFQILINFVK